MGYDPLLSPFFLKQEPRSGGVSLCVQFVDTSSGSFVGDSEFTQGLFERSLETA